MSSGRAVLVLPGTQGIGGTKLSAVRCPCTQSVGARTRRRDCTTSCRWRDWRQEITWKRSGAERKGISCGSHVFLRDFTPFLDLSTHAGWWFPVTRSRDRAGNPFSPFPRTGLPGGSGFWGSRVQLGLETLNRRGFASANLSPLIR